MTTLVTANGIQYSNGFAETYDPRRDPNARETSFEPAFDDHNQYSHMGIESQNDARIVVRVCGALVSDEGKRIANPHTLSMSSWKRWCRGRCQAVEIIQWDTSVRRLKSVR